MMTPSLAATACFPPLLKQIAGSSRASLAKADELSLPKTRRRTTCPSACTIGRRATSTRGHRCTCSWVRAFTCATGRGARTREATSTLRRRTLSQKPRYLFSGMHICCLYNCNRPAHVLYEVTTWEKMGRAIEHGWPLSYEEKRNRLVDSGGNIRLCFFSRACDKLAHQPRKTKKQFSIIRWFIWCH